MPIYEYHTKTVAGKKKTVNTIVADTPRDARDKLRSQGIAVESIAPLTGLVSKPPLKSDPQSSGIVPWWYRFRLQPSMNGQASWFTREMATLLRVGTPMVDAIDLTILQSTGGFRHVLQDIREQIASGHSLGTAIRRHPHVFDSVLCEMVTVGEQSGALQAVLKQGAEFRERREKLKDRVLSAMLYPSLVLLLSVVVSVFLMTVVTPTLLNSLQELQKELPLPTQILKAVSDFLIGWGIHLVVGLLVGLVVSMLALQRPDVRRWRDRLLLRIPILKTLIVKQNCSRLCMVTGTLLRSGVELVRALEIAQGAIANSVMSDVVEQTRKRLASGADLGTAVRANGVFPLALVQVFTLGQNTGELEDLLFQIAEDYDHQVGMLADRLTTILEPILIVGLSVIVGFILLATLLPILETGNALSDS